MFSFYTLGIYNILHLSPLNIGQHFGNRECPLFRGFADVYYMYMYIMHSVNSNYFGIRIMHNYTS